ncbi:MAG: 2OG-Fe(II) oxygenase [Thiobacillaceae bacterium]|jgi:hypothetical protein
MASNFPPFHALDEAAIAAAELRHDPYDYAFTENAIALDKDSVLADAPVIPYRGSYGLPSLRYGPAFESVIADLLSPHFRHLVERKFDMDLSGNPPVILMMGNTSGNYNEGYAHPDSKHKIVTVILGFSREWPYEAGRLRVLRSPDRNDYEFEFPPVFGNMLMFRVSDKSWHGFLPQKGPRMSLQLCYCDSESYVKKEYFRHKLSAFAKSFSPLRRIIGMMPRDNPAARAMRQKGKHS